MLLLNLAKTILDSLLSAKKKLDHPSLPWLFALLIWAIWMQQPFFGGGMATQDQLGFSLDGASGSGLGPLYHAEMQGRVYFLFTKAIDILLSTYPEMLIVQVVNITVFSLAPLCFGYVIFKSNAQRLLFVWIFYSLVWQGFLHLPPSAYPVVNHLPFLIWALIAWLIRRIAKQDTQAPWPILALIGALSFVCFFQYEPVAFMGAIILPWIIHSSKLSKTNKKPLYASIGIAAILYCATYLAWSRIHPTSYDGTEFGSFSLGTIFHVFIAYTAGALPFYGNYNSYLYLKWGDPIVGETLYSYSINHTYPFDILGISITVFAVIAMLVLYFQYKPKVTRITKLANPGVRSYHYWILIVLLLIAINGPLGLSEKYQSWVVIWNETYLTSNLALFPICAGFTSIAFYLGRIVKFRRIPIGLLASIALIGIYSFHVRQHNAQLATNFRSNIARWDAVSAIAKASYLWNEKTIISPELYFGRFTNEDDWGDYWSRFVKKRFNATLEFSPKYSEENQTETPQAISRIYTRDDGRLRAITIQTEQATFIISRKASRPPMLFSNTGEGMPLYWHLAVKHHTDSFKILKIDDAKPFIGLDKKLSLAWSLPTF